MDVKGLIEIFELLGKVGLQGLKVATFDTDPDLIQIDIIVKVDNLKEKLQ